MAAYLIVRVQTTNHEQYAEYIKLTPALVEKYGGKFLVRGAEAATLEGETETRRLVVIEFPSAEQAQTYYHSDDYQAAKAIRKDAADAQFIVVDSV